MLTKLPCGCTIDDAEYNTIHEADGRHYPIGTSPETFCVRCDLFSPCIHTTKNAVDINNIVR